VSPSLPDGFVIINGFMSGKIILPGYYGNESRERMTCSLVALGNKRAIAEDFGVFLLEKVKLSLHPVQEDK
jgi:hypothetical protein